MSSRAPVSSRAQRGISLFIVLAFPALIHAQRTITAADYARAEKFLAPTVNGLVVGGVVAPTWLPDGRFWYRNTTLAGAEVVVIDPVKRDRQRCDANATTCAGGTITAGAPTQGGRGGGRGGGAAATASKGEPLAMSPDGRRGAFVRDWNLWVKDIPSGQERPLHLAQEARAQRDAELKVKRRAQCQRTCQERKEKQ